LENILTQDEIHKLEEDRISFYPTMIEFKVKFVNIFNTQEEIEKHIKKGIINFENCLINCDVTFERRELNAEDIEFSFCHFAGDASWRETTFIGDAFFEGAIFSKPATWKGATFEKRVSFNKLKYGIQDLNFTDVLFKENGYFYKSEIDNIDLKHSTIEKNLYFLDATVHKTNRESARIIKHEFLKIDNRIESLVYHALEMNAYLDEIKKEENSFKSDHPFWEKFILYLSKWSNGYGLNLGRSVLFTILTGLFFFTVYVSLLPEKPFEWGWNGILPMLKSITHTLNYFPEFLSPTHSFQYMRDIPKNGYIGYLVLVDFIGRIFIGFGIYQTIQTFRKYGRK